MRTSRTVTRFAFTSPRLQGTLGSALTTLVALTMIFAACAEPAGVDGPIDDSGGGGGGGGGGLDLVISAGNAQTGVVGQQLALPLAVRVLDGGGQPVSDVPVVWGVVVGGGSLSADSTTTDGNGDASSNLTTGQEAGVQGVAAVIAGDTVGFEATAIADVATAVSVNPVTLTLEVGASAQLSAEAEDQFGNVVEGGVSWVSSDPGTAAVDASGLLSGQTAGSATITATVDAVQAATQVQVVAPSPVQSVQVTPASRTLASIGSTAQFEATARDSLGNTVPTAGVNWMSSDEEVFTVNANGLATARGMGTALIMASAVCCGSPADTGTVIVDPPPPVQGFPNLPGGWNVVNDNPWNLVPNWNPSCPATAGGIDGYDAANGWGKIIAGGPGGCPEGEGAVVQLADAPDGDPDVFRMTWNPGHPPGEDGYGVAYTLPDGGSRDLYFAVWFRFGEAGDPGSFKRQGNGLKMFAFDGHGAFRRANMGWSDIDFGGGPCPDAFGMDAPDGQFGDSDHWTSAFPGYANVFRRASCMAGEEHHQRGFYGHPDQGHDPSVRMAIGEWHLVEIRWDSDPARIRWWWDGVEAADFTGGTIPAPVRDIYMDGTWGGGPSTVPAPQHWYIARTVVAVP